MTLNSLVLEDHASDPHIITYVARLWATIGMLHAPTNCGTLTILRTWRFFVHWSEDHCRLSSDQSALNIPDSKWNLVLDAASRTLLFGLHDVHRARFKSLWLDRLVNTSRWRKYVSRRVENLKQTMSWVSQKCYCCSIFSDLIF